MRKFIGGAVFYLKCQCFDFIVFNIKLTQVKRCDVLTKIDTLRKRNFNGRISPWHTIVKIFNFINDKTVKYALLYFLCIRNYFSSLGQFLMEK